MHDSLTVVDIIKATFCECDNLFRCVFGISKHTIAGEIQWISIQHTPLYCLRVDSLFERWNCSSVSHQLKLSTFHTELRSDFSKNTSGVPIWPFLITPDQKRTLDSASIEEHLWKSILMSQTSFYFSWESSGSFRAHCADLGVVLRTNEPLSVRRP